MAYGEFPERLQGVRECYALGLDVASQLCRHVLMKLDIGSLSVSEVSPHAPFDAVTHGFDLRRKTGYVSGCEQRRLPTKQLGHIKKGFVEEFRDCPEQRVTVTVQRTPAVAISAEELAAMIIRSFRVRVAPGRE